MCQVFPRCLEGHGGPVVAATDYVRAVAETIGRFVPGDYVVLGTDGFGRSDGREGLRRFFEVDADHIAYAAAVALADSGGISREEVRALEAELELNRDRPPPESR